MSQTRGWLDLESLNMVGSTGVLVSDSVRQAANCIHFYNIYQSICLLIFVSPWLIALINSPPSLHLFSNTMKALAVVSGLVALLPIVLACGSDDSCYGPTNTVEHVRHVKRIQPGAPNAKYGPKAPLEWGQLNILHTVCHKSKR